MNKAALYVYGPIVDAARGWRTDPTEKAIKVALGLVAGRVLLPLGFDQYGIFMDPKWQGGLGRVLSGAVYRRLPAGRRTAWTIKALEILSDASKIPVERRIMRDVGFVCDPIATLVTQPAWSLAEVAEKLLGVWLHPERVDTREQVELSMSNVYGTLIRYAGDLLIWRYGDRVYLAVRRRVPIH